MSILFVALGGALGAVLRYATVSGTERLFGTGFPVGTLVVNVAGSLLMGFATALVMDRLEGPPIWMPAVTTGLLGGFTTFSAFSLDAYLLMEGGRFGSAVGYMIASVVLSIAALVVGIMLARAVSG